MGGSYDGKVVYDNSKPDGTPRKLVDVTRLTSLGCKVTTTPEEGLKFAYQELKVGGGKSSER